MRSGWIDNLLVAGWFLIVPLLFQFELLAQQGQNLERVISSIQQNRLTQAQLFLTTEITQVDPGNADAWYLLGYAYARQFEFIQMKEAFHKALELNKRFKNKGIKIQRDSGIYFSAEDGIDKISRAVWRNAFLNGVRYFSDALALQQPSLKTRSFEQAVAFFKTATIIAPDSVLAFRNLAAALMNVHRYSDAIGPLKRALGLSPHDDEIRAMLDSVKTLVSLNPPKPRQIALQAPVISLFEPAGAKLMKDGRWSIEVPATDSDSLHLRGIVTDETGIAELRIDDHNAPGFAKVKRDHFHLAIPMMQAGERSKVQISAADINGHTSQHEYSIKYLDKKAEEYQSQDSAVVLPLSAATYESNNTIQMVLWLSSISVAATWLTFYLIPWVMGNKQVADIESIPVPEPGMPFSIDRKVLAGMGKTWAVLIANSKYVHWPDLQEEPYEDVSRLKRSLERYLFHQIIETRDLKQHEFEPYLESIFIDLQREHVGSLLLYYAGHGDYNPLLKRGYWIPIDASIDDTRLGYLDDQKIKDYIKLYTQQANHVLLLADCCFSGHLLRSGSLHKPTEPDLHHLRIDAAHKSATAITSGRKEEKVLNESSFSRVLVDFLSRNRQAYIRDEDLAYEVTKRVRETIRHQEPQFDRFAETDELGKFIFIRNQGG